MSTPFPRVIYEENLSYAWGRAFLMAMKGGCKDLMPLTISIGGLIDGLPVENDCIRRSLDLALEQNGKERCSTSAMLIFPFNIWRIKGQPHIQEFSEFYMNKYLPKLRSRDDRNRRGTYFERMIAFGGVRGKSGKFLNETKNQLEHIISLWLKSNNRARPRRSALQVACFDPVKDHNGSALAGFPCLQQVGFIYDDAGNLAVNAFYPTQYIFDRAYGNYLGLCHLGYFMAHELGLKFARLNCFVGRPERGKVTKDALHELIEVVREALPPDDLSSLCKHERG